MYDITRRKITALLFLLFGPGITVILLGAVAVRKLPIAVSVEKHQIQDATGWEFGIGTVIYPKPNVVKYIDVVKTNPRTGKTIISCPDLSRRTTKSAVEQYEILSNPVLSDKSDSASTSPPKQKTKNSIFSGFSSLFGIGSLFSSVLNSGEQVFSIPKVIVTLDPAEKAQNLSLLSDKILDFFGKDTGSSNLLASFVIDEVDVQVENSEPTTDFRITMLNGQLLRKQDVCRLDSSFVIRGSEDDLLAEAIRFTISQTTAEKANIKDEAGNSCIVEIVLETKETKIPTKFLALFLPGFAAFGDDSLFQGRIRACSSRAGNWNIFVEDTRVFDADFSSIASKLTDYKATGKINLCLYESEFRLSNGEYQICSANGWFEIKHNNVEQKNAEKKNIKPIPARVQKELLCKVIDELSLSPFPSKNVLSAASGRPDPLQDYKPNSNIAIYHCVLNFKLDSKGCAFGDKDEDEKIENNNQDSKDNNGLVMNIINETRNDNSSAGRQKPMLIQYYLPEAMRWKPIPFSSLLSILSPDSAELAPLTSKSQRIIKYLPAEDN